MEEVAAREQPPRSRYSKTETILLGGLLVAAVLAFGAVEPWAVWALELGAAALCGLQLWRWSRTAEPLQVHPLYPALIWITAVVILQLAFSMSAYRWITASQFKGLIALEMLFFVAAQLLVDLPRVRSFFLLLTAAGFSIALFAIVQQYTGNGKIYWVKSLQYGGSLFGPYVNKNHYAGLMELLFPLPLFLGYLARDVEKKMLLGFIAAVMAATIFLSNSRGGMLACIVQILFTAGMFAAVHRKSRAWMVAAGTVLGILGLVWWLNDREVVARLLTLRNPLADDTSGNRLTILRDSIPIIRQHPWFGTGLGTFPNVYPAYRSFYSDTFVNAAHNDYLQLIVETGFIGALALVWFFWIYVREFWRLLREWHLNPLATFRVAAAVSCLGLLVHSFVDFNLHIPANAALFFVLLAVATRGVRRQGNK